MNTEPHVHHDHHRTGMRRVVALLLFIIFLSFILEVVIVYDVRYSRFEDGSHSIGWCEPNALCDSEREGQ